MAKKILSTLSATLGEYILLPRLSEKNHRSFNVVLKTPLVRYKVKTKPKLSLNIPFTSAVMQAVSGSNLGIALAKEGGLSFIFCSQPIESQSKMVRKVKQYKAGFVKSKANVTPRHKLRDVIQLSKETGYSTIAVTEDGSPNSKLLGLITGNDYWEDSDNLDTEVKDLMTPFSKLTYGLEGIELEEANQLLRKSKKSCVPIINNDVGRELRYLVFKKDLQAHKAFEDELVDSEKRLLVGAGVNIKDYEERIPALVKAGADILCVDTSDGFSESVADVVRWTKKHYPKIPIGAGNVVDGDGFKFLAEVGADFIKVGIGGGSICITQDVKGIGRGQASALIDVAKARNEYCKKKGVYVPICSDGGLVQDSHIIISLAFGADFVMMGRYFARCEESPTEKQEIEGGIVKPYWGEGSARAKNWQRYHASTSGKKMPFEEGVEGQVPYAGFLSEVVRKSVRIIKSTMANCGSMTIRQLHEKAVLERRSPASIREGNPHDIQVARRNLSAYKDMLWGN